MAQAIDVIYEDQVLKPTAPIEGVREHETLTVIVLKRPDREALRELAGTLSRDEADAMQRLIDEESGHVGAPPRDP